MADQKITALTENTTPVSTDLVAVVDDPAGTPATQKMTLANLLFGLARISTTTFTRDLNSASGAVAYTGVGFPPKGAIFISNVSTNRRASWGVDASSGGGMNIYDDAGNSADTYDGSTAGTASILAILTTGNRHYGYITTYGSDGYTITWTKEGTITGTLTIIALNLR